jgi:hypothetical protein
VRRATAIVLATVVAVVAVWAAGLAAAHGTAPSSSSRASVTCYGKERWAVKTLADPASSDVNLKSVKAGVADLWPLKPPPEALPLGDKRAAPWELTTYRVTAKLVQARFVDDPPKANGKGGGDRDYHLVIAAPSDPSKTMVVEFPDPLCVPAATASVPRARMARARERFETLCGHAPRHSFYDLHGTATITGVGFFDRPHATGHALHGFELHPVLTFRSSNCVWGNKTKKT